MSLSEDKLLLGWGKIKNFKMTEIDRNLPCVYVSDFFLRTAHPWKQYQQWTECTFNEFRTFLNNCESLESCEWIIDHPERFKQGYNSLNTLLQKNQLKKAVLYLFAVTSKLMSMQRLQYSLKNAIDFLEKKAGHLYGHWNEHEGILGITPEILFSHSEKTSNHVKTMALAGTSDSNECQQSFLSNLKQQHEHNLVVNEMVNALSKFGPVKTGSIQLLKLPSLVHLMTPIEVELKQSFCFESLVKSLHPTPALGAIPKIEGKKWLESYNIHTPRQCYGAPIGFKHPFSGLSKCFVGIRNVQWNENGMRIGAGCGIVKESEFNSEWKEILIKIRAVRNQLDL